ncbi:MAG: tRNA pseudouridine(55) synthase TruB [Myxococcota bacterium]
MKLQEQGAYLVVDKPVGPTSHDVVAQARRALGTRDVGHAGTLDPFASGVLVLLVGAATRLADVVGEGTKRYRAEALLGVETTTDDLTGEPTFRSDADVSDEALLGALDALTGHQLQVPPAYSAKHVGGRRAYELARAGEQVALKPAEVHVEDIALVARDGRKVIFDVTCGRGTYIRALARDLGRALGVGAHLTALRRTAVGPCTAERATPLAELAPSKLGSAAELGTLLPHVRVPPSDVTRLIQGGAFRGGTVGTTPWPAGTSGVVLSDAGLLAVGRSTATLAPGEPVGPAQVTLGRRFPSLS